jgi:hypothetical protein
MTNDVHREEMGKYRDWLIRVRHKSIESYDRAVFVLSGGALGLSITFIREIAPHPWPYSILWLKVSWTLLVLGLASTFASLLTSHLAFDRAIRQVDEEEIHDSVPGGRLATATTLLNVASAVFVLFGIVCLIVFVLVNLDT